MAGRLSKPTRLVISGVTGRMGSAVAQQAARDPDIELLGGIDRDAGMRPPANVPAIATVETADSLLRGADVVIDFSAPPFLRALLEQQADALAGAALAVGTTGLGDEEERLLNEAAERLPVLTAANFSVGVNLLLALAERTASVLGVEFDVEIVEAHHRRKEDAPSGTALALGEAIASGRGVDMASLRRDGRTGRPGVRPEGEIGFHAIRGGDVIGEHQVHFIGALERLELTHRASDRALFAAGALRAAHWLVGRAPGRYKMREVLGF